ncbi:MAG: hypothetical protein KF812_08650 [Fimbriimonadaceae bacterium]|nr:hypothetical protein [Fimbriimonadaceae bacterium]
MATPNPSRSRRRIVTWVLVLLGLMLGFWLWQVAAVAISAKRAGFFDPQVKAEWTADREENLKALHTAMKLYMQSEGALPPAESWSDAVRLRLKTADLTEEEAAKKLMQPDGKGGYGYNESLAGKYFDDLDPLTIVIYETEKADLNQHGSPPASGHAITVSGEVVENSKKD